MILSWRYIAHGRKPQLIVGKGFILRRSGTDSAVQVTATIVGTWSNVIATHGNADRISTHGNAERINV